MRFFLINYTTNAAATFRLIAPQCLVKGHVQFVRVASVGELRGGGGNCFIALWPITFELIMKQVESIMAISGGKCIAINLLNV